MWVKDGSIVVVGTIIKDKYLDGYRIVELKNMANIGLTITRISDYSEIDIKKLITYDECGDVANVRLVYRIIEGTCGALNKYPVIQGDQISNEIIILSKLKDGYKCCNASGKIGILTNKEVINHCKKHGVSNGKLISENGNETIACIDYNKYTVENFTVMELRQAYKSRQG